jgi:predicted signal transduction protein with EAL and GGDEF domain
VRYIPELNWYLFVDKREDGALSDIRQSLYLNLSDLPGRDVDWCCTLLNRVIKRFQMRSNAQATLDSLTGLPNRRGFDLLAAQAMHEAQREHKPLTALLLDLDHFKASERYLRPPCRRSGADRLRRDLESCLRIPTSSAAGAVKNSSSCSRTPTVRPV